MVPSNTQCTHPNATLRARLAGWWVFRFNAGLPASSTKHIQRTNTYRVSCPDCGYENTFRPYKRMPQWLDEMVEQSFGRMHGEGGR